MPLLTVFAASSMGSLVAVLVPIIIIVIVALIILVLNDRFAPDESIKKIVSYIVYGCVLIAIILKLFPLLGIG